MTSDVNQLDANESKDLHKLMVPRLDRQEREQILKELGEQIFYRGVLVDASFGMRCASNPTGPGAKSILTVERIRVYKNELWLYITVGTSEKCVRTTARIPLDKIDLARVLAANLPVQQ